MELNPAKAYDSRYWQWFWTVVFTVLAATSVGIRADYLYNDHGPDLGKMNATSNIMMLGFHAAGSSLVMLAGFLIQVRGLLRRGKLEFRIVTTYWSICFIVVWAIPLISEHVL